MSNVKPAPSSAIPKALKPVTGISLGLGLTNECNLKCAFCYRDPTRADRLSLEQVKSVMERLPVRSVNLGTGENGMHPEFKPILAYLRTRPAKLTITSNGSDGELHRSSSQVSQYSLVVRMHSVLARSQIHGANRKAFHHRLDLFERETGGGSWIAVAEGALEVAFVCEPK